MKRYAGFTLLLLASVMAFGAVSASAATKKPTAKKTAKPAAKANASHYVKGTTQLKGEYAEFGTTYTLGKASPFNITLKSAEYAVEPVKIGSETYIPNADEKLLILHMIYHNPQPNEFFVRWDSFGFTVVDPQSQNHDCLRALGMEKDKQDCAMTFKPAQKVEVYGVMTVPAAGEMPKLIIKSADELVLRYDLKGKVKGLQAPYVDSADSTGATPLTKINAQMGTAYSLGALNMKLNNVEYTDKTKMGEIEANEGERFLLANMDIKNVTGSEQFVRWDTIDTKIIDVDGAEVTSCVDMFQKSKDKSVGMDLTPGQEITVRCMYTVPEDTDLKSLTAQLADGRMFIFDISGVK